MAEQVTKISYRQQVVCLLDLEAEAIRNAANRLRDDESINRALELLAACEGKVVLLGVGKSGIIAQKIAATMTSTGCAALFLHPSDALHGGLGIVARGDVVILLSNSGETDELVQLLPSFKGRRIGLIAILGSMDSTIARACDVVLDASVDKEACPLNLAPTASTTVALALGDALAMTLMEAKGWTTEDFAVNHPAGRLGKRLTLRVSDLMHAGKYNPTIGTDAGLLEAVAAISRGGLGAVCVVDESERLIGIITDGDVRRIIGRAGVGDLTRLSSRDIMTHNPIVVAPDLLAYDALRIMEDRTSQISVLPVVDDQGRCIGAIRIHDIVRSGLS